MRKIYLVFVVLVMCLAFVGCHRYGRDARIQGLDAGEVGRCPHACDKAEVTQAGECGCGQHQDCSAGKPHHDCNKGCSKCDKHEHKCEMHEESHHQGCGCGVKENTAPKTYKKKK